MLPENNCLVKVRPGLQMFLSYLHHFKSIDKDKVEVVLGDEYKEHDNQTFISVSYLKIIMLIDLNKPVLLPKELYKYIKKNYKKRRW